MHMAFQMVIFVLDDPGFDASEFFLMFHEILIKILDADAVVADHILVDAWQT